MKYMGRQAINYSIIKPEIMIAAYKPGISPELGKYFIAMSTLKFHYLLAKNFRDYIRNREDFWDHIFPYLLACGSISGIVIEVIIRLRQ